MGDDEKFLSRWAKRKEQSRARALEDESDTPPAEEGERAAALDETPVEDPEDHPAAGVDIESLDADSDFSVFMHEKVPQALRRRALRKLWLSDPIYANLDGLNDYDDDFTDAALVVDGLKAAYDEAVKRMNEKEAADAKAAAVAEGSEVPETPEDGDAADAEADVEQRTDAGDEDLEDGTDEA